MTPNDHDERSEQRVGELEALAVEPSAGFTERLRRRIARRETSSYLVTALLEVPLAVILTFLELTFSLFHPKTGDRGGSK